MKNINNDYEKWLFIGPFVLFWLGLIQLSGNIEIISIETLKKVPDAVMLTGLFYILFSKYLWKISIFRGWLIPFPNLQGTWEGFLQSTWINPETGKEIDPIPVQFCIRQDFENIHITLFTKESESYSQAAKFLTESDGTRRIKYTYTNKPKATVRERSEIHDGAANIKIVENPTLSLIGEYWTSRKTTGEINIKKINDNLIDAYCENKVNHSQL